MGETIMANGIPELPPGFVLDAPKDKFGKPFSVAAIEPRVTPDAPFKQPQPEVTPEMRELAGETAEGIGGFLRTGAISTGRGLAKIGRALGLVEPETTAEKEAFEALRQQRPVTTPIGEAVGESLPFAAVPVGAVASVPGRIAATGVLGATEGALIRRGEGATAQEQLKGAGVGGAIATGFEAAIPVIGRIGGKLIRQVTGKAPKSSILAPDGLPTEEFADALAKSDLTFEDVRDGATQLVKAQPGELPDPEQQLRKLLFEELEIPATKGDITQEFKQQAIEARLFESAADPLADPVRTTRLRQSEAIKQNLDNLVTQAGVPDDVGSAIKKALISKKAVLKSKKNALYKKAAKSAKEPGQLPFPTEAIESAIPDARTIREIKTFEPQKSEALFDLLAEFGIDQTDEGLKRLKDKNINPIPLSIESFDTFRKSLNRLMEVAPGQPKHISVLAQPIKDALDNEAENLSKIFKAANVEQGTIDILEEARRATTQFKQEFSPESIAGRLIGVKRDGVTPIVEASQVFKNIVGTNKPIEVLDKTIKSLKKAGPEGIKAIGDLQAATVMDLIESAFKAEGRKVQGAKIFGTIPFSKRLEQIGDDKLKLIFSTNPRILKDLNKIKKITKDITPPSGAVPKGSASVILDTMNKLGLMTILSKVPGGGLLAEGMTRLSEGQATRAAVKKTLDARPDMRNAVGLIEAQMPSVAVAFGLTGLKELEGGENE